MNPGFDEAYRKAQDLLARRAHFSAELRHKLKTRGFLASDIDSVIDRLTEFGYLDDLNNGRQLAAHYLWKKGYGRLMIAQRLQKKGLPSALARQITAEQFTGVSATELEELFSRLSRKARGDIYAYLYRRGFLPEEIEPFVTRYREGH
ncbi:MAG: regulatory protein RecX [Deltaproteobacteria bacterium]|nr:regulatory protein RecX [Deltaproteobacteria bacterium]